MGAAERIDVGREAERVARVLRCLPAFGDWLEIKTKTQGLVTFAGERWHPEQRRFERTRTGRDLVLKPRQIGFSTLELARDLQFAVTRPGVQVLIVGQDSDLAQDLFDNIRTMVDGLEARFAGTELDGFFARRFSNRREIVFRRNGSAVRVVEAGSTETAAAKRGRSGTVHRLHATEVAFWGAPEETMTALLAAVPDQGEVVIESTPNGAAGLFYDLVQTALGGGGEYRLHFFSWLDHPTYRRAVPEGFDPTPRDEWEQRLRARGATDEQIAWWRARVDDPARGGLDRVLQEYPVDEVSCFRAPGGAYVPADACDWLATQVRDPIARERIVVGGRHLGDLAIYEQPDPSSTYVAAADVAEGVGGDASAIDVSEWRTGRTVATFWSDTIEAGDLGLALAWAARKYNHALAAPERNNHGAATLTVMVRPGTDLTPYGRIYTHDDGRHGWPTTPATRPVLFDDSRTAIVERSWLTPDKRTAGEARTLIKDSDGKPRARGKGQKGGAKDDAWVAKAIGWQVRQRGGDGEVRVEHGARRETAGVGRYW